MNYLVTIGLEIHAAVNSKRKLFSPAANNYNAPANSCVHFLDLGLPGTLPVLNLDVVKKAIQLGHFFNMTINYQKIVFDRKNYYYFDLPKGFQISQYYYPIAKNGFVELKECNKKIKIIQIQIEEDTAKQTFEPGYLDLDYNRSGAPLLEIVSEPSFTNAQEVLAFLVYLKRSLIFNDISDGKIELGNLRVDVNISLRKNLNSPLGTKVEIKNIGSFSAVVSAIEYEIKRQSQLLDNDQPVLQETRKWSEQQQQTIFMRSKSDAIGYSFIPEANLPEFGLSDDQYHQIIHQMPTSWLKIQAKLIQAHLTPQQIDHLLDDYQLFQIVDQVNHQLQNYQKSYKWVAVEILGFLNRANQTWTSITDQQLEELIKTIIATEKNETINGKQAKVVFDAIINEKITLNQAINKYQLKQINDVDFLKNLIDEIIVELGPKLTAMKTNPIKLEKVIIGQIMVKTNGQANPNAAKAAYEQKRNILL